VKSKIIALNLQDLFWHTHTHTHTHTHAHTCTDILLNYLIIFFGIFLMYFFSYTMSNYIVLIYTYIHRFLTFEIVLKRLINGGSLFPSLSLFSTSQAVSNFLDLLPLMLSLFPVELHLGDSLNREQPPFITGFFSFVFLFFSFFLFFRIFYLCCRRVVFIRVILFFYFLLSSFSTFASRLNTKGSDISVLSSSSTISKSKRTESVLSSLRNRNRKF